MQHLRLSLVVSWFCLFILSLVKVIRVKLYLDKFDISKRHLVNVFCFVMLIIPFLNANLTVAKRVKMETVYHAPGKTIV